MFVHGPVRAGRTTAARAALGEGAVRGWNDFVDDLSDLSFPTDDGTDAGDGPDLVDLPSFTDVVNAFTAAFAAGYAPLLPTADIVTALLTTAPAYAIELVIQELSQGNLFEAIGLPLAALAGLGTTAVGFEFLVISSALDAIATELDGVF